MNMRADSGLFRWLFGLLLMSCLGVSPCHAQDDTSTDNGGGVHSIAVNVTAMYPNTVITAKIDGEPVSVKPRSLKQANIPQWLHMEGKWLAGVQVTLSLSAQRGSGSGARDPAPEALVQSAVIDGISFLREKAYLDPRLDLEVSIPKWRWDSHSPRFQLTLLALSSDTADLNPPTLDLICDDRELPYKFVILSGKAVPPISIPLGLCGAKSNAGHALQVKLVSDPLQLSRPLHGRLAFFDASGNPTTLMQSGGDGAAVSVPAEFDLTPQQSMVGYQTVAQTPPAAESSDTPRKTTPVPTNRSPVTSNRHEVPPTPPEVTEQIQTISRKINFVFFVLMMLIVGVALIAWFGFIWVARIRAELGAVKSLLEPKVAALEQITSRLDAQLARSQHRDEDALRTASGGDDRLRQHGELLEQMRIRMDAFAQRTDAFAKLLDKVSRQTSEERSRDSPARQPPPQNNSAVYRALARDPSTRSSMTPPPDVSHTNSSQPEPHLSSARLKDVVLEYDGALRDSQDAMSFFERHHMQILTPDAERTATGRGHAILVNDSTKPALAAQFWGLQTSDGRWWVFPGFGLYSQRNALSAGGWREAKESLSGLYELVAGSGFLKIPAGVERRAGIFICLERGMLELPHY